MIFFQSNNDSKEIEGFSTDEERENEFLDSDADTTFR